MKCAPSQSFEDFFICAGIMESGSGKHQVVINQLTTLMPIFVRSHIIRHKTLLQVDMAPLADLGFLLVAFFMLSTQLLSRNIPAVNLPEMKDYYSCTMREVNRLIILVSKEGKIYYRFNRERQRALTMDFLEKRGIQLSAQDRDVLAKLDYFGMDDSQIPSYLKLSPVERKGFVQSGISVQAESNQLSEWLQYIRMMEPRMHIDLECDEGNKFPIVKQVIQTLQDNRISRFSLLANPDYHFDAERNMN
jgi:biopolymer transport protein ExbD